MTALRSRQRLRAACDEGISAGCDDRRHGISPRDVTPDATLAVIDKPVPGITGTHAR